MVHRDTSFGANLGAAFLGVVTSALLFGITTLQVFIYYQYYPKDALQHQIAVPALWLMDGFHLALAIHGFYFYLASGIPFVYIVWSMRLQLTMVVMIAFVVTSLYAWRIYQLGNRNRILIPILLVCQALELAAGLIEIYACYIVATYREVLDHLGQIKFALGAHMGIDIFLALAMCYYLQEGRQSAFTPMRNKLAKLMQYIIGSGVATSACAMAVLISIAIVPTTQIWVTFYYLLSKLYVNSFLALLNARRVFRRNMDDTSLTDLTEVRFSPPDTQTQATASSHLQSMGDKPPHSRSTMVTLDGRADLPDTVEEDGKLERSNSLTAV